MLPPQLNLVLEIEFADATTALWSENAGAHPAGATLSTDFEVQNVRVLASQVVLDSALVESFNRVLLSGRSLVFSYPTVHTQQSTVPLGVAEHNVTVARAFTKLMGAFVTFWDNDAGSKIHLLANPGQDVAPISAARQEDSLLESQMQLGSLQYPHNPMKGASEHFHFLPVLAGTYDDTVRNIDIDRAGYLRHRRVHPPDSLSAGDALWHRSLCAGLAWIHSSIGRGAAALKLADRGLDSTRARIIFSGERPWEFIFSLDPRRISETDLSTSCPVSASPGNEKFSRRIFPPPAQ